MNEYLMPLLHCCYFVLTTRNGCQITKISIHKKKQDIDLLQLLRYNVPCMSYRGVTTHDYTTRLVITPEHVWRNHSVVNG